MQYTQLLRDLQARSRSQTENRILHRLKFERKPCAIIVRETASRFMRRYLLSNICSTRSKLEIVELCHFQLIFFPFDSVQIKLPARNRKHPVRFIQSVSHTLVNSNPCLVIVRVNSSRRSILALRNSQNTQDNTTRHNLHLSPRR